MYSLSDLDLLVNEGKDRCFDIAGVGSLGKALFLLSLFHKVGKSLLIVSDKASRSENLYDSLKLVSGSDLDHRLIYFPSFEILPYEKLLPHHYVISSRLKGLKKLKNLSSKDSYIFITNVEAISRKVAPLDEIVKSGFELSVGSKFELDVIAEILVRLGYSRVDSVYSIGEFAIRGSVLDIYLPDDLSVRVEFYDDTIESIRRFSIVSQRSVDKLESFDIEPLREINYLVSDTASMLKRLSFLSESNRLDGVKDLIESERFFPDMESYLPIFYETTKTILDYLPSDILKIVDEPLLLESHIDNFYDLIKRKEQELSDNGSSFIQSSFLFEDKDRIRSLLSESLIGRLSELAVFTQEFEFINLKEQEIELRKGELSQFKERCEEFFKLGISVFLLSSDFSSLVRLKDSFNRLDIDFTEISLSRFSQIIRNREYQFSDAALYLLEGKLDKSVAFPLDKVAFVTDKDLISGKIKPFKRSKSSSLSSDLKSVYVGISDLAVGDYVVHQLHGVGRYLGVKEIEAGNALDEYLHIEYGSNQRLFLPVDEVNQIKKYVGGSSSVKLKLDTIGSKVWKRLKAKVKEDLLKMAKELVSLAAKRSLSKGVAHSSDNQFHEDFAASFEHEATIGQLNAIDDVRSDMESDKAMDRIILGDVGYGKTEVAVRASFKSVYDGHQVAVLVPTTLLASQHYEKFSLRFSPFGIKVDYLSRVRSVRESKDIMDKVASGEIDILISTHKLFNKRLKFRDLGLIVVDEEQKFGVKDKERVKAIKENVDILTLTATPIPRTLQSCMLKIRDISLIESPPPLRESVENLIASFSKSIIKDAIRRELDRGGQIFFVNNRITGLAAMANWLGKLEPDAKVRYVHGQMNELLLAQRIKEFVDKKIDVLVTTTIIESGIDIPNANTMIINRADHFGLAQLYQLRGRVGRDRHRGYCYFLIPGEQVLTDVARKRLKTISDLSELGSGFKLASRDLEIRGAGNLLGSRQSGHIDAVGFDTYVEMLDEAITELKGEKAKVKSEVEMNLAVGGRLLPSYIPSLNQRLLFYNRLNDAESIDEIEKIKLEISDRFGKPPLDVIKLFLKFRIKIRLRDLSIYKIESIRDRIRLSFAKLRAEIPYSLIMADGISLGIELKIISEDVFDISIFEPDLIMKLKKLELYLVRLKKRI